MPEPNVTREQIIDLIQQFRYYAVPEPHIADAVMALYADHLVALKRENNELLTFLEYEVMPRYTELFEQCNLGKGEDSIIIQFIKEKIKK